MLDDGMLEVGPVAALVEALGDVERTLLANAARSLLMLGRISALRSQLRSGVPLPDLVTESDRPLLVELISANLSALQDVGAVLRRCEASALRDEGIEPGRIAALFGVSRQRVATILRHDPEADA
jgi:hypothetical protein